MYLGGIQSEQRSVTDALQKKGSGIESQPNDPFCNNGQIKPWMMMMDKVILSLREYLCQTKNVKTPALHLNLVNMHSL